MQQRPLRVSQGALKFRCEYNQGRCTIRMWITNNGFNECGSAIFDNEFIMLKITANKKGRKSTIVLSDFVDNPGQRKKGVHRNGEYELLVKKPCFDWFTESYWKTSRDEEIYVPPSVNLCVHPNPHHKIEPVGMISKPFQGGSMTPR